MKSARAKPGGSAVLVQRAAALQAAGQANEAAQLLSQAVNQFPAEPEPWLRLGNLLAGAGQWATAERCYAARCRLKPPAAQPFYNWGVSLVELGRVPEAVAAYERAIALQPGDAAATVSARPNAHRTPKTKATTTAHHQGWSNLHLPRAFMIHLSQAGCCLQGRYQAAVQEGRAPGGTDTISTDIPERTGRHRARPGRPRQSDPGADDQDRRS